MADIKQVMQGIDVRSMVLKRSVLTMIAANIAVAAGALVFRIDPLTVIWAYWAESVAIGLLNVVRMLSLKEFDTSGVGGTGQRPPATTGLKVFLAIFFMFHYGFFHVVYAVFLAAALPEIFGGRAVNVLFIVIGAFVLFASNCIGFLGDSLRQKREHTPPPNIGAVMMGPYARILPVHLTILLGAFLGIIVGFFSKAAAAILLLVLFTVLKISAEIIIAAVVEAMKRRPAQG